MSNIGGPIISPTDQITFSIDRLLQEDEHDDYSSSSYSAKNNNNNNAALLMSDEDEVFVPCCRSKKECDDTSSNTSSAPSSSSSSSSIVRGRLHRGDRKKDLPPLAPKKKEKSTQEEGPSLLPAGAVVVPSASNNSNNSNNNNVMMMNQPIHKLSPALLHTFNQVQVGNTAVQVGSASSSSSSTTSAAVTMFNNNNNTPAAVTVIEINKASDFFSRAIAFAQTNDWDKVELVCDALAEKVKSMLLSEEIYQGLNLRKEAIEFAQREFDAAFDARSKDIKRRHNALMIVAYLFAASGKSHKNNNITNNNTVTTTNVSFPSIISEKIMVWALYRVLNNNNNNNNENTTTTTQQPPLYALLSLAQGLDVASCYFAVNNNKGNNDNSKTNSSIGLQHLPVLVTKLCNGLVYAAPSKQQHETLCSSITKQTAILHRFNNSTNNNNMEAMKKQL